jgi:hypothetical protein
MIKHKEKVAEICRQIDEKSVGLTMFLRVIFVLCHYFCYFYHSDMSPEVHCNLCNHCYTLGMPDPRPEVRCVQYLPKVH